MPTYVYYCESCEDEFETYQAFSDKALTTHDVCGGAVRKVFKPTSIVFKGSGFYVTDSRAGKKAKKAEKSKD